MNESLYSSLYLFKTMNQVPTAQPSWADPQLFLKNLPQGPSQKGTQFIDVTDFVEISGGNVTEEVIVSDQGQAQIVLRSGARKPALSSLSVTQWSLANLAILRKLIDTGRLSDSAIMDYLSYTAKTLQLVQRYEISSVWEHDRDYRKLQSQHGFRWGTDVSHLHLVHLRPRINQGRLGQKARNPTSAFNRNFKDKGNEGKETCRKFNSRAGCPFTDCKFVHVCSVSGCGQKHSYPLHDQLKN